MERLLGPMTSRDVEILNDLAKLIPLGTLSATKDLCRLPSPEPDAPDGWKWLPPGLFPTPWRWLEILAYLNTIRLTYLARDVFLVRVYCVPEDIRKLGLVYDKTGRDAFERLLREVNTDQDSWNGSGNEVQTEVKKLLQTGLTATLAQIYNDLDSPSGDYSSYDLTHYEESALKAIKSSNIPGLVSQLYPYQARSVQSMFLRESYPTQMLDPRLLEIRTVNSTIYLSLEQHRFWKLPVKYDTPKGFILGEEMGSGKTCESLALILITLDQIPYNPAMQPGSDYRLPEVARSVWKLCDLAAAAVQRHAVPYRWHSLSQDCMDLLDRHAGSYIIPPPRARTRSLRSFQDESGEGNEPIDTRPGTRIWLTHGTLVVVPDTLVSQWRHEINKHVQSGVLRVLVITSSRSRKFKDEIPPTKELSEFDLVLISHSRFSKEEEQIGTIQPCNCSYSGRTREIICKCPPPVSYVSPLTSLHWKRLIVDEGHSMASTHTKVI